jgi:hypothetical protein
VVALIVFGAGAAAAQTTFFTVAPTEVTGGLGVTQSVSAPVGTTTGTTTSTTMADSTSAATTSSTPITTTNAAALPSSLTGGIVINQIVGIARSVEPAAAGVTAFTVPAGQQLVLTDVVITNPNAMPLCGAGVSPSAVATTTAPAATGTTTTTTGTTTTVTGGATTTTTPSGSAVTTPSAGAATIESGTGTLCVAAHTSLSLTLITGLEFASGQSVVLANQPPATTAATSTSTTPAATPAAATTTSPLLYHLRGFLVTRGV